MMALGSLVASALFVAVGVLAWGSAAAYLAHPARALAVAYVLALTALAVRSGVNFSAGKREDTRNRWVFLPFVVGSVAYAWLPLVTEGRGRSRSEPGEKGPLSVLSSGSGFQPLRIARFESASRCLNRSVTLRGRKT